LKVKGLTDCVESYDSSLDEEFVWTLRQRLSKLNILGDIVAATPMEGQIWKIGILSILPALETKPRGVFKGKVLAGISAF
jgi:hypothetical protein